MFSVAMNSFFIIWTHFSHIFYRTDHVSYLCVCVDPVQWESQPMLGICSVKGTH